jgi:hypothetical protein
VSPVAPHDTMSAIMRCLDPRLMRAYVVHACVCLHACAEVTFDRFMQTPASMVLQGESPPEFTTSFFFHQESASGSIILTFQQPGIYYYGARPSFDGRPLQSTAGGMFDGAPSTHPTALVVTGPGGETGVNQSLPDGFAGEAVNLPRLKTAHQFCITEQNLTIFSGAKNALVFVPFSDAKPIVCQDRLGRNTRKTQKAALFLFQAARFACRCVGLSCRGPRGRFLLSRLL